MHILIISDRFVTPEEPLAGIFQRNQALALKRAGLKIGIIAPGPRSLRLLRVKLRGWPHGIEVTEDEGISVYRCQKWNWTPGRIPHFYAKSIISIGKKIFKKYIKDHEAPDAIHAHNSLYSGLLAAELKQDCGIPFVLTEHSTAFQTGQIRNWQRPFVKSALRNASIRAVVSNHLGNTIEQAFPDVAAPWIRIPNIIDGLFEYQDHFGERNFDGNQPFRFLTVGNLIRRKNQDGLLRSFAQRFKGSRQVQLRIGGEGPLHKELEEISRKLGIDSQVVILGRLTREQLLSEMQNCDSFVLPSLHETFGVVLIEALACGKPVIATVCGGPEEIVNSKNGILVPPGDEASLAEAMLHMVNSIDSYDCSTIRQECLDKFGEAAIVNQLQAVYDKISRDG